MFGFSRIFPGSDQLFYLAPALAFLETGSLAIPMGGEEIRLYALFGTYSLTMGLFFKLMEWLGLSVTAYSYGLFQALVVLAMLAAAVQWLRGIPGRSPAQGDQSAMLFLALLPLTPFSMNWPVTRPEPLGLGCLFSAMILSRSLDMSRDRGGGGIKALGAGFLYGFSAICHPLMALMAGGLALMSFLGLKARGYAWLGIPLLVLIGGVIPILILAMDYLSDPHVALAPLLDHAESLSGQENQQDELWKLLGNRLNAILHWRPPGLVRLAEALYFLPFFAMLAWVAVRGWGGNGGRYFELDRLFRWTLLVMLLLIPLLMYISPGFEGVMGVLAVLLMAWREDQAVRLGRPPAILLLIWLPVIGSWPLLHAAKPIVSSERYPNVTRMRTQVASLAPQIEELLLVAPEGGSVFLDELRSTFRTEERTSMRAHILFPGLEFHPGPDEVIGMQSFLMQFQAMAGQSRRLGWLVALDRVILLNDDGREVCLWFGGAGFGVQVTVAELVKLDRKFGIVISQGFAMGCSDGNVRPDWKSPAKRLT
ncbi:MAG: hypothetical protein HQL82_02490 [Magnetococcales bacterium]|nr:hypothetical protein [Magnetococcales bacterium]